MGSTRPGPLRHVGFRALYAARTISLVGDGVTRTALVLLTSSRGAAAVATILLAATLPRFLGPLGGAIADRMDRRRLMRVCDAAQAALLAIVAVTLPPLPVLTVLVAVTTLFTTAFGPASSSCVPDLVDEGERPRANALIGTTFTVQIAVGPALGGLLVGLGSARFAFAADAGSFLVSAVILGWLPPLPPVSDAVDGVWRATAEGLSYARRTPVVRSLLLGLLVFVAFAAIDNVALVFLVRDRLGGSPTDYGLVLSLFGVGMLTAAVLLSRMVQAVPAGRLLVGGAALTSVASLATALAPGLAVAAGAQALAGAANGVEEIADSTYLQELVPAPLLGRVFGAVGTAAQVGSALAYLAGAPLVSIVGPRGAFAVAAGGSLVGLVLLMPVLRPRTG